MGFKQIGNFVVKPSNTGKNWVATGQMIYNIEIDLNSPSIKTFGIDTEGGDRAKLNLLRKPIELIITLVDFIWEF